MPSRSRLSPRYMTKGVPPSELLGGQHRVGEPARRVLLDVGDLGAEGEPSPAASRISSPVSGAMMIPISVMPASTSASIP